jgi:SAM-dependent methyltransferase
MQRTAHRRRLLDLDGWPGGAIPFEDGSLDLVVCRQRLQFLEDRQGALAEIRRVLVARGRIEITVWGSIERNPAFAALAASLERRAGPQVAAAVRWLFCLSDPEDLRALLAGARFEDIRIRTVRRRTRVGYVGEFVRWSIPAFPVGAATAQLNVLERQKVLADLEAAMAPWAGVDGVTVPTELVHAVASPAAH